MGLYEVKGGMLWKCGEVRDDVGGGIGRIGGDEVAFTKEREVDDVVEEVCGGTGGEEGERKKDITLVGEDVEGDGGVVL